MSKLRWGALGVAVLSVGLLATPASAAKVVTKFRDKGATAIVTDCPASGPAGTKCIAFVAYASKARFKEDGTVTAFASLGLDKYRVTLTSTGFTSKFLFGGFVDNVQLSVADDLSSASASGVVPIEQCNNRGRNCTITNYPVSFSLNANAPEDFFRDRSIQKMGDCTILTRFNARSRTADGTATVRGVTYPTTAAVPSSIDFSAEKVVLKNCEV